MATDKYEKNLNLNKSKLFLKSVLLPALEYKSCIENQMILEQVLIQYDPTNCDSEEDDIEVSSPVIPTSVTEDIFSKSKQARQSNYFVCLNMVGMYLGAEDIPPYFLTIISRNNKAHLALDHELDEIATDNNYQCEFEHDLESYAGFEFQNWVSKIPLDCKHLKFLKDLFTENEGALELINTVEANLLAYNARNYGYQTLISLLERLKETNSVAVLQETASSKNVIYFGYPPLIDVEKLTAKDLVNILSEMTYAYISMSQTEYDLLNHYFSTMRRSSSIRVAQENPLVVGIKFANVNEAGEVVCDPLFVEDVSYLDPVIKATINRQIQELKFIFTRFYESYFLKLQEHYKNQSLQGNDTYILSTCQKPLAFKEGFQSRVTLYKEQCKIGFFIADQLKLGAKENIQKCAAPIDLPASLFLEHGDTILANMLGGNSSSREMRLIDENLSIYMGWEYGLKFTDLNPDLKKIYCDRGEDLETDNLSLVIPLVNLTLYFMLRYLEQLEKNSQPEIFRNTLQYTAQFIIDNQLALPEKYQSMFYNSNNLFPKTKDAIREIYDLLFLEQLNTRKECMDLEQKLDEDNVVYLISDEEEDEEVVEEEVKEPLRRSGSYNFFDRKLTDQNSNLQDQELLKPDDMTPH